MPTLTLDEIIVRAQQLATGVAGDSAQSALNDSDMTLEALFPQCVNYLTRQWTTNPSKRTQLRETQSLTFSSTGATIPDGLVEDWPLDASWYADGEDNINGLVTYCPHRSDAMHHRKSYLYYAWTEGSKIRLINGNGDNYEGSLSIIAARQPQISGANVTGPEHFLEDLAACLASVLRGELPLAMLFGVEMKKK